MKVYFSGSAFYRDDYLAIYKKIKLTLTGLSLTVLGNIVELSTSDYNNWTNDNRVSNYKQILKWVDQCDFAVIESSFPSTLHVGHEISLLLDKGKPVIGVYKNGHEPKMFMGIHDDRIRWVGYRNEADIEKILKEAVIEAKKNMDVRFNFFVSPKILNYLDYVAKNRMIPRAVFLRDLIEREMKKDKDFAEQ
ncbi:MAG: hypothetical protein WCV93_01625 [Candidatus Shapirobacteria bacterium]